MNNSTFVKELKNQNRKETIYEILHKFLSEKKLSIGFLSKFRAIKQLFFKKEEKIPEVINKNIDSILAQTNSNEFLNVLELLANNNETTNYVKDNIQLILAKALTTNNSRNIIKNMEEVFYVIGEQYGEEFADVNKEEFIIKNIDSILSKIDPSELLEDSQKFTGISNAIDTKINNLIVKNKSSIIENMIRRMKRDCTEDINMDKVVDESEKMVTDMLEKYMKQEHVRWIDIKKIQKLGSHKDIYQIGTKALRMGIVKERKMPVPDSPRIMKPIESMKIPVQLKSMQSIKVKQGAIPSKIDQQIESEKNPNEDKFYTTIEMTDKVEQLAKNDLEGKEIFDGYGEDIYQLYKELRNANIIWIDAPHSLGFRRGSEKTQENMMILDLDSLYNSQDSEGLKKRQLSEMSKQFEIRYRTEREEKQKDNTRER